MAKFSKKQQILDLIIEEDFCTLFYPEELEDKDSLRNKRDTDFSPRKVNPENRKTKINNTYKKQHGSKLPLN